jgi:site-specific DNA recombinase
MFESKEAGLRLAVYAGVSSEEQREGKTVDSQVAELEEFAAANGWTVAGAYKDEGWSGSIMARPALDRLRDDARVGRFDAVLINDVDRLARDVSHLGVIKRDLEKQNLRVIFRKFPSEVGPMANLMVNILGSFAEFERELICDRTRRGRRHKVERRKQYLGSNTAYGYRYRRMDRINNAPGRLSVEPREAQIVRKMFEWVDAERLSASRIARRLNQQARSSQEERRMGKVERSEAPP